MFVCWGVCVSVLCVYLSTEADLISGGYVGGGGGGSCGRPYALSPVRFRSSFICEYGKAARENEPSK